MERKVGTNFFAEYNEFVRISFTDELGFAVFAKCYGDPNSVAMDSNVFAVGCYMIEGDILSGLNVYIQIGTLESPSWALVGAGSGAITGNIQPGEVAFGTDVNVIGGSVRFTFEPSNGTLTVRDFLDDRTFYIDPSTDEYWLGDVDGQQGNTVLLVASTNQQVSVTGMKHATPSNIIFTGTGLNDFTTDGMYIGNQSANYSVRIDSINNGIVTYDTLAGGNFQVGDTITITGGPGAGTTAVITNIGDGATYFYFTNLIVVGSGPVGGDPISNGAGVTANANGSGLTPDTFSWSDSASSGSGSFVPITGSDQPLDQNIFANFTFTSGHTLGDEWDFSFSVAFGEQMRLQGNDFGGEQSLGDIDRIRNGYMFSVNDPDMAYNFTNLYSGGGLPQLVTIDIAGNLGVTSGGGGGISIGDPVTGGTPYENLFVDASGNLANSFEMFDSSGLVSVDNDNRFLYDAGGNIAATWNTSAGGGDLRTPGNIISVGWVERVLNDTGNNTTFQWGDIDDLEWGDVTSSVNGTKLIMDDSIGGLQMNHAGSVFGLAVSYFDATADFGILQSGHGLYVNGPTPSLSLNLSGNKYLEFDNSLKSYQIGDVDGTNNSTRMVIDDAFTEIYMEADGGFNVTSAGGKDMLRIATASLVIQMGDLGFFGNNTNYVIDDFPESHVWKGIHFNYNGIAAYANNAAAVLGGLNVGDLYYTNVAGDGVVKIVL